MAMKRTEKNGRGGNLESAMALLIQNQAQFVSQHGALDRKLLALKKESVERWGHIEALLIQHDRMLKELPEAIRLKIGYQK